ncbi:hypothetical protein N0V88_001942 [Collariella sp. IMI 366227]|nr:hypothetical protein N0V88_001942 [Collariella sp. IMI 366227]
MAPVEVEHHPSLYRSHKALGPAQHTRHRKSERTKLSVAFGSFAALGLALAISSGLEYLTLSYKVWASERGVSYPESLFENSTLTGLGTSRTGLYLRYWLTDTSVYLDALEILAEKTRRLWWGQQLDLATISWTALLAIEGRRRRIPHLWAYALLPHLVNLSFAQNLFYVALLQTPLPISVSEETSPQLPIHPLASLNGRNPPSPPPSSSLNSSPWLPSFSPTSSPSWGTIHPDPRDAYPSITKLFRTISVITTLFHAKTTLSALLYNLPGSYQHRHSVKIPFDVERRSKWERTATAIEKVLGAMTDHPVVSAAGKDVLLSAVTLGIWVAVRLTDVGNMLRVVLPFPKLFQQHASSEKTHAKAEDTSAATTHEESPRPAAGMALRRRGRPNKTSISSIASSDVPTEDVQPTPRRRGRPRKAKPEPELEQDLPEEDRFDDKTYEPTPKVAEEAEMEMGDNLPDEAFDWEPASLAWGLTALAGGQ